MEQRGIPDELIQYASDLFAPADPEMEELTRAAAAFGMPVGWEISADVGRLFQVLVRAVGAERVLEFGTLAGHSALWFARALPPHGKVVSIELDPHYAAFAREHLAKTLCGRTVEVRVGGAFESLPDLAREVEQTGQPYDVMFLDADKARYPEFLEWSVKLLRPGGLLLADNVLRSTSWNGQSLLDSSADDPRIIAIRRFNQLLARHPAFTSVIIPMRAGVAAAVYSS